MPVEDVNQVVKCYAPTDCADCSSKLFAINKVTRHQVYEIPEPKYEVTEYQILYSRCRVCNKNYPGLLPVGISRIGFGVRVHAAIGLLTSKFRTSKRQAIELLKDMYRFPISAGSICNAENRVSESLSDIHKQLKLALDRAKVVNIDETGFKQSNRWAHLKRDFQKISERAGIPQIIGKNLLKCFGRIYRFRKSMLYEDKYSDKRTRKKKKYLIRAMEKQLSEGASCSNKRTSNTCGNILSQGKSLWLFMDNPQISATNNLAERQLRPLVIAKKLSFGVQSLNGARFIERIFRFASSCKQQGKDAMPWLQNCISNNFKALPAPDFAT